MHSFLLFMSMLQRIIPRGDTTIAQVRGAEFNLGAREFSSVFLLSLVIDLCCQLASACTRAPHIQLLPRIEKLISDTA